MDLRAFNVSGEAKSLFVDWGKLLGKGATANVYAGRFDGERCAVKIYHQERTINETKLMAMLRNPPANVRIKVGGVHQPQFAWPIAVVKEASSNIRGIVTPLVDLSTSYSLDHYYDQILFKKLFAPAEAALSFKLEIARNLSILIADLHAHGHYAIDLKPQNVRVQVGTHVVTLLDCDGFSIADDQVGRFPAELISTDYISPEAFNNKLSPTQLGEAQDSYALAVMIFQLLNRGIHPFQGILQNPDEDANTNDEKAAKGLYPHGRIANSNISPKTQSIHHLFHDELRELFDKAFTFGASLRPTARQWAKSIDDLLKSKVVTVCDRQSSDVAHMRFVGKDCPACYLSSAPKYTPPPTKVSAQVHTPFSLQTPPSGSQYSQTGNASSDKTWWGVGVAVALLLIWIFTNNINTKNSTTASTSSTTSQTGVYTTPGACTLNMSVLSVKDACELVHPPSNVSTICASDAYNELVKRNLRTSKHECGRPVVEASKQAEPSSATTPKSALNDLYKINGQVISASDINPAFSETWVTAVNGVIESLNSSKSHFNSADGLIIHRNVRISPFQALRFSVGSPDCRPSNFVSVAGFCQAESNNLVCAAEIDVELENQKNAGKKAYLCVSAFIK
jgi:serine/threonine protein kinase